MANSATTRLIVNADDFGMTAGVNRAVEELHVAGALTSATLMAQGAAFGDAARIAREHPMLGVGCHVVLVDGFPTANVSNVATLLAPNGQFSSRLWDFSAALHTRYVRPAQIQQEAEAQIAKLQDSGVRVTHVDTHKHTHMYPRVAEAVMLAARARGVLCIRNPFEPAWSRAVSPATLLRRLQLQTLDGMRHRFLRLVAEHGMCSTDGALGVLATGTLNGSVLNSILGHLPSGTFELVCHPGYNDTALQQVRTRLRETRETERTSLLGSLPQHRESLRLVHFGELTTVPAH